MARQQIHSAKAFQIRNTVKKERKRKKEASEKYVYPKKYQERLENDYIRTRECGRQCGENLLLFPLKWKRTVFYTKIFVG